MRILIFSVLGVLLLGQQAVIAQQPKRFTTPLAGTTVLKDVDDKYSAQVTSLEMPDPDASVEQKKLDEIKELIKQKYPNRPGPKQKNTNSVLPPTVFYSYIADSFPQIPPDNYMSVSKANKGVSVMNSLITVQDATNGAYLQRKSLYGFSSVVGLSNPIGTNINYRFDPKVVYDPVADRYICVMLNSINQYNWIVLAFSKTNDPAGAWNFYKLKGDYLGDTTWFDYPAISITKNEFFLTGNKIFYDSSWQGGFRQTLIYQIRKQNGYDGDTALTYQIWDSIQYNNKNLRCLYPLNPGDSLLGPSQYFLSNRNFDVANDSIFIVKVPDTIGSAANVLTVTAIASPSAGYGVPPNARQPDTTVTLATNDGRVLGGFMRDNEIQFVSTSLNTANGSSAIYHGVISNVNTTPALSGRLISIDSLDFGYPNISFAGVVAGSNQSIISYEFSGPRTFPGFGAVLYDGTGYSDMTVIKTGDGSIKILSQKEQRWGDYSGSQPDWTTLGSVWVLGIFGRKDHQYGNYMARLQSPYRVGISDLKKAVAPTPKLYPNPAIEFVNFDFTVEKEQEFNFAIYDLQGREVAQIVKTWCREGKNIVSFNIAPLPTGTYLLKASGNMGETIPVHTFVRK